ncbi:5-methylcytosine-specific restriction enzyme subunit McrC [Chryseobacterium sp. SLBN-27]|uniref:5-methylcytosine restriction system specificity protein McrC n=1 Tax=Chryseobacterium sp. SLBN-27 TaxID=3042287 RepID=UPI0028667768|nr:restriction endonuclease [Chryseobacterium sp. SLBN-27]MDR6157140.1 5-methylcytosine-specific restriction enzyme subunit McrC [Chryseobacterium sp. SLBN-27]
MGIILKEHIHYSLRITENWYDVVHEERKNYFQKSALSQIKPRFFKEERGKDYPCYKHTVTENEVKIISDYFVGIDWLTTDKSRFIQVEPKLNDKVVESFEEATKKSDTFSDEEIEEFNGKVEEEIKNSSGKKEVDVIGMLMQIMSHSEVSKHTRKLLFVDWEDKEIEITQKQDLLTPFLIVKFLNLLRDITKKGLKKSYYKKQENLRNRVKGKILVGQQIRQNVFKNRLTNTVCEYQVFGEDSMENRFLNKVFIFCTNYIENNKIYFKEENEIFWLINYIRPSFEHIGSEINIQEIKNYKHNPFFKEYKEAITIGQQILKRFSYNITKTTEEKISTPPFWIDMPKMFELYVYAQLLKDNPGLQAKDFNYQFSTHGNALDFLICTGDKKIVVDAKYKLHYNYSQVHNDIRQVAGYARLKKVKNQSPQLNEEIECLIIYPKPIGSISENNLSIDELQWDEINAYHKVYKIGISLPMIK